MDALPVCRLLLRWLPYTGPSSHPARLPYIQWLLAYLPDIRPSSVHLTALPSYLRSGISPWCCRGQQISYGFTFRHRCPPGHSGYYHTLADTGQGIFHPKGCGGSAERADSGTYVILYPSGIQTVHLFPYGAIEAGIPGVEAHRGKTVPVPPVPSLP